MTWKVKILLQRIFRSSNDRNEKSNNLKML